MRDAQKHKVLKRANSANVASPGAYGFSDEAGQIHKEHYNHCPGRAQTHRGLETRPPSTGFPYKYPEGPGQLQNKDVFFPQVVGQTG